MEEFNYVIYNKNTTKLKEETNIVNIDLLDNCIFNDKSFENANIIRNAYLRSMQVNKEYIVDSQYLTLARLSSVIKLSESYKIYLNEVGCKTRNMIKKSEKNGYNIVKQIIWNDYIDDIMEINMSTNIRQGKQMKSYYSKKEKRNEIYCNEYHFIDTIGCINEKDNKLYGYLYLRCHNNSAIISRILGNEKYKTYGIMNKLIAGTVNLLINDKKYKHIKYLIYLVWDSTSLTNFKKNCGFRPYILNIKYICYKNIICNYYNLNNIDFKKLYFTDLNINKTNILVKKENIKININNPLSTDINVFEINKFIKLEKDDIILDIGSSHGKTSFLLGILGCKILGVEILNKFFDHSINNNKIINNKNITFIYKDIFIFDLPKNIKIFYIFNSIPLKYLDKLFIKLNKYYLTYKKTFYLILTLYNENEIKIYLNFLKKYNYIKIENMSLGFFKNELNYKKITICKNN